MGGFRLLPAGLTSCPSPPPAPGRVGSITSPGGVLGEDSCWMEEQWNRGKGKMLSPREGPVSLPLLPLSWDRSLLSLRCQKPLSVAAGEGLGA